MTHLVDHDDPELIEAVARTLCIGDAMAACVRHRREATRVLLALDRLDVMLASEDDEGGRW